MQKGFAPLIIILGILVILGIAGGAFYLGRSTISNPSPTPAVSSQTPPASTPQSSLTPDETANWKTFEGKSSYYLDDSNKGRFVLYYPENCGLEKLYSPILKCLDQGFSIYPEASGRGAEIINQTEVKLGNYSWTKRIFKVETGLTAATYDLFINDAQQLIEVHYDKYSPEIEMEAEKIITTFKTL